MKERMQKIIEQDNLRKEQERIKGIEEARAKQAAENKRKNEAEEKDRESIKKCNNILDKLELQSDLEEINSEFLDNRGIFQKTEGKSSYFTSHTHSARSDGDNDYDYTREHSYSFAKITLDFKNENKISAIVENEEEKLSLILLLDNGNFKSDSRVIPDIDSLDLNSSDNYQEKAKNALAELCINAEKNNFFNPLIENQPQRIDPPQRKNLFDIFKRKS
ncbi:MAG: hypothetical protein PHO75_04290 [Candidatus Shapirobacteria bacterium]|nr:hypothetical protein [Candidatus Shapirobacteria bacterium]